MDGPGEDKAQPGGRDSPARGTGTLRCGGAAGMGCSVLGASGRYLGAVEVAAVGVGEPARPAGALVDGHVPQLDVHPHNAPGQRGEVKPRGCVGAPRAPHPVWLVLVHGLLGQCEVSRTSPDPRWGLSPLRAASGGGWSWGRGRERAGAAAPGCEFYLSRGFNATEEKRSRWGGPCLPPRGTNPLPLGAPRGTWFSPWKWGHGPSPGPNPAAPFPPQCLPLWVLTQMLLGHSRDPPAQGQHPAPRRDPSPAQPPPSAVVAGGTAVAAGGG